MARPRKYTDEMMIDALKATKGMIYVASEKMGCDADTIYNRAKVSARVAKAIKHQRGVTVDTAELKFYQAIQNGEAWAISMMLKTLGKDRGYGDKMELSGDKDNPIKVAPTSPDGSQPYDNGAGEIVAVLAGLRAALGQSGTGTSPESDSDSGTGGESPSDLDAATRATDGSIL